MKKYKLAILTSHLVQYHAPLFKKIAKTPLIDLFVYYYWDFRAEGVYSKDFQRRIQWDIPFLDCYKYKFLKNYSLKPSSDFWGQINPSIIWELRRNNYDAILVFGYNSFTNCLVFLTKWFHKTPIILRGEADLNKKIGFFKKNIKIVVLKLLFRIIDAFLYSYSLNKKFFHFYGAPDKKLFFYPCAVDNERFSREYKVLSGKRKELRKKLGIGEKSIIILFSGTLIKRKRPFDLLRAYELITKSYKLKAKILALIFVGDGALRPELENYTKEHSLKNVHFAGFKNQTELPKYYAIADIFVLPSELDPSPKVLNEVMNFGVPIITTTGVGTAEDLIVESKCGFIYEAGNIDSLFQYLKTLIEDSELRKKSGENSLKTIQRWSFDKDIDGVIAALKYIKINAKK